MLHSPYVRCPACRILVFDPELKLAAVDTPAPCCGARRASREICPGLQALKLLEIAESQDQQQPEGHRIMVLFFASALEVMLEDVLVELLQQHTPSEALSEAVLDSHQGIVRRRDLFGQLAGTSLGDLLREDWDQEFLRDWNTLAARRNKVAHGSYYYRGSEDVMTVHRMRNSYVRAFADIHNHVTRRAATAREET